MAAGAVCRRRRIATQGCASCAGPGKFAAIVQVVEIGEVFGPLGRSIFHRLVLAPSGIADEPGDGGRQTIDVSDGRSASVISTFGNNLPRPGHSGARGTLNQIGTAHRLDGHTRESPLLVERHKKPFDIQASIPHLDGRSDQPLCISVVPDAVFGLRYSEAGVCKYRFFALEIDRGTMPVVRSDHRASSYQRKLLAYQDVLDRRLSKSLWGLPNFLVLTISPNAAHLESLLDCAARLRNGQPAFLFKAIDEDQCSRPEAAIRLFEGPWISADGRAIDILKANS